MGLCKELKIDDPITWMNSVAPELVDLWLALYIVDDPESKEMKDPAEAMKALFAKVNNG
jgi:hypothetical protein